MKKDFLKRVGMPIAIAILGIGGAFVTTSMGASSKPLAQKMGHQVISGQPCQITNVTCQTESNGVLCRLNYSVPSSPQLYGKLVPNAADCPQTLYRVFN